MKTGLIKQHFGLHNNTEKLSWILVFAICCVFGFQFLPMVEQEAFYDQSGYDTFYYLRISHKIWDNMRHPILGVFLYPFVKFRYLLDEFLGVPDSRFVIILLFGVIVAYSYLFLFRIVRHNSNGNKLKTWLSMLTFVSMAHVIMQFIACDSFAISMMLILLSLQTLYYDNVRSRWIDNILFLLLTGTTLSNGAFFLILFLFTEKNTSQAIKRLAKASIGFIVVYVAMLGYVLTRYYFIDADLSSFITEITIGNTTYFSNAYSISTTIALLWEHFWCEAIAFHADVLIWHGHPPMFSSHPVWLLFPIISLLTITIVGIIKTKAITASRIVSCWLLYCIAVSSFYGLIESYIACAHWAFTIPIVLSLVKWRTVKMQRLWMLTIGITVGILLIHNISTFVGFFTD